MHIKWSEALPDLVVRLTEKLGGCDECLEDDITDAVLDWAEAWKEVSDLNILMLESELTHLRAERDKNLRQLEEEPHGHRRSSG